MNDEETQNGLPAQPQPSIPMREPLQPSCSGVGVSLDLKTIEHKKIDGEFVYSAKFLCGKIPHSLLDPQDPAPGFPLVPGTYRTAINIYNPHRSKVALSKTAVTTNPEGQPRGKAGMPVPLILNPNEGIEIDCEDIEGLLTSGTGVELSSNWNNDAVFQSPQGSPTSWPFTLSDPARITQLVTYHWNSAQGDPPGAIGLQDSSGNMIGPFPARGVDGENNVHNASWVADTNESVPAGTYTVVDDRPQTRSYNQQSNMAGFYIVRGAYSFVGKAPFFKGFVVIRSEKELDVVGVYTVKNVISSIPNPPLNKNCPPITLTVQIPLLQGVYSVPNLIGIDVTIHGGQPPYNLLAVTVNNPAPVYSITPQSLSTSYSPTGYFQYRFYWAVSTPVPGALGTGQCWIVVSVTDANGCQGQGQSLPFTVI